MKNFKDYPISKKLLTGFLSVALIHIAGRHCRTCQYAVYKQKGYYMYRFKTAPLDDMFHTIESLYQIRNDSKIL